MVSPKIKYNARGCLVALLLDFIIFVLFLLVILFADNINTHNKYGEKCSRDIDCEGALVCNGQTCSYGADYPCNSDVDCSASSLYVCNSYKKKCSEGLRFDDCKDNHDCRKNLTCDESLHICLDESEVATPCKINKDCMKINASHSYRCLKGFCRIKEEAHGRQRFGNTSSLCYSDGDCFKNESCILFNAPNSSGYGFCAITNVKNFITKDYSNIRKSPSKNGEIVRIANPGETFSVTKVENSDWYKIIDKNTNGFIHKSVLVKGSNKNIKHSDSVDYSFIAFIICLIILIIAPIIYTTKGKNERCPSCYKWFAEKLISHECIASERYIGSKTVEDVSRNRQGEVIHTHERHIPVTMVANLYEDTYQCKYCGHKWPVQYRRDHEL